MTPIKIKGLNLIALSWALCLLVRVGLGFSQKQPATNSSTVEDHFQRGIALYERGESDGAMARLREEVSLDPDGAEAHSDLEVTHENTGDRLEALGEYRKACQLAPNNSGFCAAFEKLWRELGQSPR